VQKLLGNIILEAQGHSDLYEAKVSMQEQVSSYLLECLQCLQHGNVPAATTTTARAGYDELDVEGLSQHSGDQAMPYSKPVQEILAVPLYSSRSPDMPKSEVSLFLLLSFPSCISARKVVLFVHVWR
jgi:hypothetical protein